jgi:acetyltransferase-like isoleucine patch superfamily enzyme
MKRPLIFVGSRHLLRDILVIPELLGIEVLGILDHHYWGNTDDLCGVPIIGDERCLLDANDSTAKQWIRTCDFFPLNHWSGSQGLNQSVDLEQLRIDRLRILESSGVSVPNLIHPDAKIPGLSSRWADYALGKGNLIQECWHSNGPVRIGNYNVFMTQSTIAHGVVIGNNVTVCPRVFLHCCEIGDGSYIGMYARTNPPPREEKLVIGSNVSVWLGAEIKQSIPNNKMLTADGRILRKIVAPKIL